MFSVADSTHSRKRGLWLIVGCALAGLVALTTSTTGDYAPFGAVSGDNAGPALRELADGHISGFLAHQPLMGLTSILLRLPLVVAGTLAHAGDLTAYRLGAFACLLPAGFLAGWLIARAGARRRAMGAAVLAACVVIIAPATRQAVSIGHPEEVLATVLATSAVVAAVVGRPWLAAVLLGAAIGCKQWTLLAAAPVLLALRQDRLRVAVLAGAVGLLLAAAVPLADPAAFSRANGTIFGGHLADPFSIWWPVGSAIPAPIAGGAAPIAYRLPAGLTRSSASAVALATALAGLLLFAWRRRRCDPLALLALLGLLRCVADPTPLEYNFVDLLIPLAVWESLEMRRIPAVSLVTMGMIWLVNEKLAGASPGAVSAISILGTAGLGGYLAVRAFRSDTEFSLAFTFGYREPITGS